MALGHAGNLDVADAAGRQVVADFGGQVALHDLAVVQVQLHFQIGQPYLGQDGVGLVLSVQEVVGEIACIDRFDQHLHASFCGLLGGKRDIAQVGGL